MENEMAVANTILHQLGGNRFSMMTGAKNFVGSADTLRFKLPANFAANGINMVSVTLNALDTYDVSFLKVRGMKVTPVAKHEGIYADTLRALFTAETGLAVSL
jgi:hypothetical protein